MSCVAVSHTVSFSDICIPHVIQNLHLHFNLTAQHLAPQGNSQPLPSTCRVEEGVGGGALPLPPLRATLVEAPPRIRAPPPPRARADVFGITSNTLLRSSQSFSRPAGGTSDGYGHSGQSGAHPSRAARAAPRGPRGLPYSLECSGTGDE